MSTKSIKIDKIPTEGIRIAGIKFLPGVAQDIEEKLANDLIERKGFKEVKKSKES